MLVWVVYSNSRIHGVYDNFEVAQQARDFLTQLGGYNSGGVPRRFYFISQEILFNGLLSGRRQRS